jgi:hypothetical protein
MKFKNQIQNLLLKDCTKRRFEKEVCENYENLRLLGPSNIHASHVFRLGSALIDHFSTPQITLSPSFYLQSALRPA